MLSMERLRALAAVAQHGSIAAAARTLHMTPSAVSQQLGKLEREAGHRLLEPQGRTVRLTHAGRVLSEHAARVLGQLTKAESDLADLHHDVLGSLRLGAVGSAVRALLPDALATLTRRHPRLSHSLRDGEVIHLLPRLLDDALDLLVVESWSNRPLTLPAGLSRALLISERVDVALPEAHHRAGEDTVDLGHLVEERWTSCPPGTEPYEALVQVLRGQGVEPRIPYWLAEFPSQLSLVSHGLAVALIPDMGRQPTPPGVAFVSPRQDLRREIHAVWRTAAAGPPVRACLAALGATPLPEAGVPVSE
ncbi:LysR family transcriptional regulator [Spiractinospora alimapuensis]|uniref:LysR family transcriptional regulator n=1 Tax=Spiractinospora alimapuensis TaxID=2820884 RepID=UPI001F34232F|nr:LysR family transcriptional regulator [Spiractinospora alimapuensis]QVQ53185.1 LysR family transcriptional regulator [Spiractinospora alimapuensis]